ncbi:hypothetical protein [Glaciihabitans sp. dw_435]|uniref:hypothetical protein n=1 Tax=Glaciihabitans sp. dw_435 TaxID=2720081 RepID=UPI001BD258F1|nr:hypothetical protein [Glaciihabitans sp. dw_435]
MIITTEISAVARALVDTSEINAHSFSTVGMVLVWCLVALAIGIVLNRGVLQNWVGSVYPGGYTMVLYIPLGFTIAVVGAMVSIVWPPRDHPWAYVVWLGLMGLGGAIAIFGFFIGVTGHPRALLPKWLRRKQAEQRRLES